MRRMILALVLLCAVALPMIAEDDVCLSCLRNGEQAAAQQGDPEEDLELGVFTTEEAMEWQCIVWWTRECLHYDRRDCDYCYLPCLAGCWPVCVVLTNSWWGVACSVGCSVICHACPNCEYCDEWGELTRHESCGWVFIE